jgi:hypothetical protein
MNSQHLCRDLTCYGGNHVVRLPSVAIIEPHIFLRPAADQAMIGTQSSEDYANAAAPAFTSRASLSPDMTTMKLKAAGVLENTSHERHVLPATSHALVRR